MSSEHDHEGFQMDISDRVRDLHTRVSLLEGAFQSVDTMLARMDKKLDDLTSLTTRMAQIEERHIGNSSALERVFSEVEKADEHRDEIAHEIARVDKDATQKIAWFRGVFFASATMLSIIAALAGAYMISMEHRLEKVEKHLQIPHNREFKPLP